MVTTPTSMGAGGGPAAADSGLLQPGNATASNRTAHQLLTRAVLALGHAEPTKQAVDMPDISIITWGGGLLLSTGRLDGDFAALERPSPYRDIPQHEGPSVAAWGQARGLSR